MKKLESKKTINRDISWMYFNRRILDEAADKTNPILERLKFIGIYSSNLDEFFRVRVATLRRMIEIENSISSVKSDAAKVFKQVLKLNQKFSSELEQIFVSLIDELKAENIYFLNETELNDEQKSFIDNYYTEVLMSHLYPILVSRMDDEPRLDDKKIYMAVQVSKKSENKTKEKKEYALIQIPTSELSRFLILPSESDITNLIFLDDVIRYCLPRIFASLNYTQFSAYVIKFTRDSEMDFDRNVYQGILEKVSKAVKSRKTGAPVRFVYDRDIPANFLKFIEKLLNIEKNDAHIAGNRYHNLKDFINFPKINQPNLVFAAQPPLSVPEYENAISMLELIREKDCFLHYPYQKFDYFIRILSEAALSPDVKSIKISIYRLAKNSKIIKALLCAAMNGKKVTANVELLARFDESSNINWSQKMQDAGINVIFGVEGLKVHSKIALIKSKSKSIACISTGNFHEDTAKIYTDFTLMTARNSIVSEVEAVFDYIEHPYATPTFRELIVSPNFTRKKIIALIKVEINNAAKKLPAYIHMKMNHIVDEKIISKLYEASNAGVEVKLLVRGNCSIITGIKGQSERIEVYGIVDRYLEHSRIMIFANGGDEKYYIGSADLMVRNLDNRIEVFTPVYDPNIQKHLKTTIEYGLKDNVKARIVDGNGKNKVHEINQEISFRSQEELYNNYKQSINKTVL